MTANNTQNLKENFRPPVVVVLGHVDHGKTSLLDTIRKTKIAEGESGGITQHIGAYQVEVNGKTITFLDTPGHEAFTAIRSRGAKVADVAILVVAADEGVKPQTKEAIRIIVEEKIPVIVAINKMDKEAANPQKIKQELASENILVEEWGGKVPAVEISAKQNKNIDGLLDMVLLVAELEDLKDDQFSVAQGVIIESHMDKRKGYVGTVLINKGVLKIGDWVVAGNVIGKVKMMDDFLDRHLLEGMPSQPIQIVGWLSAPSIGTEFHVVNSKNDAEGEASKSTNLTPLFQSFKLKENSEKGQKYLNLIFKSDVASSLEAIESAIGAVKSDEVSCRVVAYDFGNISESDIKMAAGTTAQVIGFRVTVDGSAKKLAEKDGIKIATFDIIYELVEYIRKEMGDLLDPEIKKNYLGKIKILAIFKTEGRFQIIGGKVTSGKVSRGALVDVMRNNAKLLEGRITQLQHNKEDASEVKEGSECGLKFEKTTPSEWDVKEGDILEVYEKEVIKRSL